MKKLFVVSWLVVCLPAFGYYNEDIPNACGTKPYFVARFTNTVTCGSGYFLPADSFTCTACPSGYTCAGGTFEYNTIQSQGLVKNSSYRTQNETGTCAVNFPHYLKAKFQQIVDTTCNAGYFLPAGAQTCAACPAGYTCPGGTYAFDDRESKGLVKNSGYRTQNETNTCASNFPHYLKAKFQPNTITITWNGALQSDIETNNAGTVTYGGDIRTPVRADPAQIPAGKRFVGWVFRKTNN